MQMGHLLARAGRALPQNLRGRQGLTLIGPLAGSAPLAARAGGAVGNARGVAVCVAVHRCTAASRDDRSQTLVQLEPIRTTVPGAANAAPVGMNRPIFATRNWHATRRIGVRLMIGTAALPLALVAALTGCGAHPAPDRGTISGTLVAMGGL